MDILCPLVPSEIYGAQYLHQPIPYTEASAAVEPRVIRYRMRGTPPEYLRKVYGELWDGHISDDLRDQAHLAWDMRSTYKELWGRYERYMQYMQLGGSKGEDARILQYLREHYDMVVNTIPRPALCYGNHDFRSTHIWALGQTPERPMPITTDDDIIVYNGEEAPSWYRSSNIFGFGTVEWPGWAPKPPVAGVVRAPKPIAHNCDCWPGIDHLGRMGRWSREKLVHETYADMVELMMIREEIKA